MAHPVIPLHAEQAGPLLREAARQLKDDTSPLSQHLRNRMADTQLSLPGVPAVVEGVTMALVRDYFARLLAIEEQMDIYREQQRELWQGVKDKALPAKTMRSALKIARARQKIDASKAVLEACIAVALALLPPEEEEDEKPTRDTVNMTTGEVR